MAARQVDAAVDHAPEECRVASRVALRGRLPARDRYRLGAALEKHRHHAAHAGHPDRQSGGRGRSAESSLQARPVTLKLCIGRVIPKFEERGGAGGDRQGISGERAGLEHLPRREHVVHDIGAATVGAQRQTAPDDLAERGEIRPDPEHLLGTAKR